MMMMWPPKNIIKSKLGKTFTIYLELLIYFFSRKMVKVMKKDEPLCDYEKLRLKNIEVN